jgi:hypothetical protein
MLDRGIVVHVSGVASIHDVNRPLNYSSMNEHADDKCNRKDDTNRIDHTLYYFDLDSLR